MTARTGTVLAATRKAITAARRADRLRPWHEPAAAVAVKLAKALDGKDLPVGELVRLSGELDKALSRLPLAETTTPDGGDAGDGPAAASGGAGDRGSRPAGLAPELGAGPEMGDTALPA